jgi:hypothetical protein
MFPGEEDPPQPASRSQARKRERVPVCVSSVSYHNHLLFYFDVPTTSKSTFPPLVVLGQALRELPLLLCQGLPKWLLLAENIWMAAYLHTDEHLTLVPTFPSDHLRLAADTHQDRSAASLQ